MQLFVPIAPVEADSYGDLAVAAFTVSSNILFIFLLARDRVTRTQTRIIYMAMTIANSQLHIADVIAAQVSMFHHYSLTLISCVVVYFRDTFYAYRKWIFLLLALEYYFCRTRRRRQARLWSTRRVRFTVVFFAIFSLVCNSLVMCVCFDGRFVNSLLGILRGSILVHTIIDVFLQFAISFFGQITLLYMAKSSRREITRASRFNVIEKEKRVSRMLRLNIIVNILLMTPYLVKTVIRFFIYTSPVSPTMRAAYQIARSMVNLCSIYISIAPFLLFITRNAMYRRLLAQLVCIDSMYRDG